MPEPAPGPGPARGGVGTRLLVALVVGQLGVHAAMAGLRLAAPLQALNAGHSPWAVGLLLALFAAAAMLSALGAGRYADRHGYHRPVRISVAITVAALACAFASTWVPEPWSFGLLCLAAAGTGIGTNTGMLTIQRTAGHAATGATERVRLFSWLGVAPSFSNVVGPVAAGLAIDAAGYAAAYALLGALPLVTLASARRVPSQPPWGGAGDDGRTAWELLRLAGFRRLLLVNGFLSMCWDVHTFAVPVLGHERGFSAATIGLILGTFTGAVTAVRLVIPLLAHRLRASVVVRGAMWACAAVLALYPLAPSPWAMAACAVALGLALGSVQPMVMSLLHDQTPSARHGEALALRSMLINGSSALLPLLFGATGAVVGAAVLFWAAAVVVGGGSALAKRLDRP